MKFKTLICAGWIIMFIFPTVFCCDRCVYKSKVAYYAFPEAVNMGACGYESFATNMSNGHVAAASPKIYREGIGCGSCYQIRCIDPKICTHDGVEVLITDFPKNTQTEFVVSNSTFSNLAQHTKSSELLKMGIVNIKYKCAIGVRSVYDTKVQINAIKQENCSSCATLDWHRSE